MEEKMFELMTQMYNEMKYGFKKVDERLTRLDEKVLKLEISHEEMRDDIKTIAEVQKYHIKENERNHMEIVELLSGRVSIAEDAIKKISAVK